MADGSLNFDTRVDTSGFKKGADALKDIGKTTVSAVGTSVAAVSTALVGLGTAAAKVGISYEDSLNKVASIADTSVKSIASISAEVKKLSMETGANANGLNEAVYQAISAGVDTANAVDFVETASKAAAAGFTDTATAVDGLTSVLNTYGMAADEAESLANKFLVTQNLGKTSFGELAGTIGTVAPTAAAAGIAVEELLGSVASLTANGISTSSAMAGMKAAISNIIKPTSEATETAEKLGIDFSAAALQSKGWAGFLDEIATATGGDVDAMSKLFGSVEALNAMLTLTGGGAELFSKSLDEMATNSTALDDAFETMTGSLSVEMNKLKASAEVLGTSFYESISEPLRQLVSDGNKYIGQLVDAFENGGLEEVAETIGSLLADALNEVGSYAPDVVRAAAEIIDSFLQGIEDNSDEAIDTVLEIVDIMVDAIGGTGAKFLRVASDVVTKLAVGIINELPELADTAVELVVALADGISKALPELIPVALEAIVKICEGLSENIDKIVSAAGDIVIALVNGLTSEKSLTALIEAVPVIITELVKSFDNIMWKLLEVGERVVKNIKDGILNADWDKIMSSVYEKFEKLGASFAEHISKGYNKGLSEIPWLADGSQGNPIDLLDIPDDGVPNLPTGDVKDETKVSTKIYVGNTSFESWDDYLQWKAKQEKKAEENRKNNSGKAYGETNVSIKTPEEIKADFEEWYKDLQYKLARGFITDEQFTSQLSSKLNSDSAYACAEYTSYWKQIADVTEETSEETGEALRKAWNDAVHLNELGIDNDSDTYRKKLDLIQKYCPVYSDEWYDYYKDVYDMQVGSQTEQLKETKASLEKQKAEIKSQLEDIANEYKSKYKEIQSKQENYKSRLLAVGSTFSVEEKTDSATGVTTKTHKLNNIQKRLDTMKAFHNNLKKLKEMNADPSLIQEILDLGTDSGAYFAEQLVNDPTFTDFNNTYKQLMDEAKSMSEEFFRDEYIELNDEYSQKIGAVYSQKLPEDFKAVGEHCAGAFGLGFAGDMSERISDSVKDFEDGVTDMIDEMSVSVAFNDIISTDDAYASGSASGQAYMNGFTDTLNRNSFGLTTEASFTGAGTKTEAANKQNVVNTTINLTTMLDGEKVAEVVTRYQNNDLMRGGN